jgi:hypothetical protein
VDPVAHEAGQSATLTDEAMARLVRQCRPDVRVTKVGAIRQAKRPAVVTVFGMNFPLSGQITPRFAAVLTQLGYVDLRSDEDERGEQGSSSARCRGRC